MITKFNEYKIDNIVNNFEPTILKIIGDPKKGFDILIKDRNSKYILQFGLYINKFDDLDISIFDYTYRMTDFDDVVKKHLAENEYVLTSCNELIESHMEDELGIVRLKYDGSWEYNLDKWIEYLYTINPKEAERQEINKEIDDFNI